MMYLIKNIWLILVPIFLSGEVFFSDSIEKSIDEEKEILLIFSGSDWCPSCIRLNELVLENNEAITERFIVHIADFPRRKKLTKTKIKDNEKLAEQYNPKGLFPSVFVIDPVSNNYREVKYHPGKKTQFLIQLNQNP